MTRLPLAGTLIVVGIIWGLTIPLTKVAVSTGHQPLGLIFWQLVISGVVLGLVLLVTRAPLIWNPRNVRYFLGVGMLGTIVPNSLSYLAAAQLPAGVLAIVIAAVPMFALVIALALGIERVVFRRFVGVALGAAAVVLLVGPQTSLPDPDKAVFVLLALGATACYGGEGCYIALRAPPASDPVVTLFGASVLGCLVAGPLALVTDTWVDPTVSWGPAEQALVGSSLSHAAAYTGYIWLLGRAGPVFASQVAYVVTVAGVFLSAWLLAESYSVWIWAALGLMMTGLALVRPRPSDRDQIVQA